MSADHHLRLLAAYFGVLTVLLGLWFQAGLAAVLVGVALTDLGLTLVDRRRSRQPSLIEVPREPS